MLPRILIIPARVFGRAPASEKLFEKRPTSVLSQSCTREEARLRPLSVRGAPLCPRWLHTYASWSLLLAASVCRARGKDQTPPGRPIEKMWSLCRHPGTRQKWKRCFSPEKVSFRCWVASVTFRDILRISVDFVTFGRSVGFRLWCDTQTTPRHGSQATPRAENGS